MLQIKVAGKTFDFSTSPDKILIDGVEIDWDLAIASKNDFHIIWKGKSYSATVISFNREEKSLSLLLNNKMVEVKMQNQLDLLLEKMGIQGGSSQKVNDLKAPMPGRILNLMVQPGQEVKQGESLLILEAMKMENMIKSPGDGVVKEISVKIGDNVEKNQLLVRF